MKNIIISPNVKIIYAMKRLSKTAEGCLIVTDNKKKILGTLTDGDIRRGILKGLSINKKIDLIYSRNPMVLKKSKYNIEDAKKVMTQHKQELLPIINKDGVMVNFLSWESVFGTKKKNKNLDKIVIVIMAGGKGDRLTPFTKILPKPLIPINDKPVIEHIIEKFILFGSNKFYITVNYKSLILKSFFKELKPNYSVKFLEEKKPLGTIGGLQAYKKNFKDTFFVTNCDVIVDADYSDIYNFHKNNRNDITLVASTKDFEIPYGICKLNKKGRLASINEKPRQNFLVSTGLYVLNPKVLNLIPKNKFFHMTQLIKIAKRKKLLVGLYPVEDSKWVDIGQWSTYKKYTNY